VGLGSDIGAGTSFSIFQTMNEAYKVISIQKSLSKELKIKHKINTLDPFKAFYLATLGLVSNGSILTASTAKL